MVACLQLLVYAYLFWLLKMYSPHEIPLRQPRDKLTNKGSLSPRLSPPKKPTNHKPTHDIPETSEGAEEAYYSRFEYELDSFHLLLLNIRNINHCH